MATNNFDGLEERIAKLENRIFGTSNKDAVYAKVTDALASVNSKINSTVSGRPKAEIAMTKLAFLEKCLEPAYFDEQCLDTDAKLEIILAEEELIRQQTANLQKVHELTEVLGSEHIKAVPSFENKLKELSRITLEQQDGTAELADNVKSLLAQYNSIVSLLSKQFIQWESQVAQLEVASMPKKPLN